MRRGQGFVCIYLDIEKDDIKCMRWYIAGLKGKPKFFVDLTTVKIGYIINIFAASL